jgi:hypothetical protein
MEQPIDPRTRSVAKTGALLLAILVHNLTYPLSVGGGAGPFLFYIFYASIFVAGTWALTADRFYRIGAALSGLAVFAAGLINSYAPSPAAAFAVYLTSLAYHGVMIIVLARYTFLARTVMTDVVLAATSLYLVIGSAFSAVFAIIEWLQPGSFATSSGGTVTWQQMIYYSYVTLTTVGYGDITPTGFYAQAFSAFEGVLGVLYTVLLLSRLVGLHTSGSGGRERR